jgi:hypothetical protein|tara:strand:+ start:707 stop:1432 length:726 start_codon:yes stop_codon:yes gene_type:complete
VGAGGETGGGGVVARNGDGGERVVFTERPTGGAFTCAGAKAVLGDAFGAVLSDATGEGGDATGDAGACAFLNGEGGERVTTSEAGTGRVTTGATYAVALAGACRGAAPRRFAPNPQHPPCGGGGDTQSSLGTERWALCVEDCENTETAREMGSMGCFSSVLFALLGWGTEFSRLGADEFVLLRNRGDDEGVEPVESVNVELEFAFDADAVASPCRARRSWLTGGVCLFPPAGTTASSSGQK